MPIQENSAVDDEIAKVLMRLNELEAERVELEVKLRELERPPPPTSRAASEASGTGAAARMCFPFVGRKKSGKSGYAPACANEWVRGVCNKPNNIGCDECRNQAFIPVSDEIVERHLRGSGGGEKSAGDDFVASVYPMLPDERCWFLGIDFDKENWAADALAVIETCVAKGVPAGLERSRSGNGGHVWLFFSEPIAARLARQLGSTLMTATMERRPELSFSSYDRFFPSQDIMPTGGFGNLIALPLQRKARENANSLFVDQGLRPYDDQ